MQDDKSAFEGWIIAIKALVLSIKQVRLTWEIPTDTSEQEHYNRFLYRVIQFSGMYSWFTISDPDMLHEIENFKKKMGEDLVINYPTSDKKSSKSETHYEDIIESLFVNKYSHLLFQKTGVDKINQQLPVGVFRKSIGTNNRLFTGQKSAIDLWGVNEKREALYIFELKYDNKGVGIISELFFYLCIMNEIFLKQNSIIKYTDEAKGVTYRGLDQLYGKKFDCIKGYFLTDELHPLVNNPAVIDLFNQGLAKLGKIQVESLIYKWDKQNKIITWK